MCEDSFVHRIFVILSSQRLSMAKKIAENGNLHSYISSIVNVVNLENVSRFDGGASQLSASRSASTILPLYRAYLIGGDLPAHSLTWALGHV